MNNFLQTLVDQFTEECNVSCILAEQHEYQFLNPKTEVIMSVYKDEVGKIISVEFTGV